MLTYSQKQDRLRQLVERAETNYAIAQVLAKRDGRVAPVRHKCFISYHGADIDGVVDFVEEFNEVFIPRVVGVSDSDYFKDPINSQDEDYIKDQIGKKYLSDSTVTILYVGGCTWSRKYVDWELSSTLRNSSVNKRNGLLAITPRDRSENTLPARFSDNWKNGNDDYYARYQYYPTSESSLRGWIEDAFQARTARAHLVDNSRKLKTYNNSCP